DRAGLVVPGAEHQAIDPRGDHRSGAHRAGLEGDHQRALLQTPAAQGARRRAQSDDLGVAGGIRVALAGVAALADHLAVADHDGAHRDVARGRRIAGQLERATHEGLPAHPTIASNWSANPRRSATSASASSGYRSSSSHSRLSSTDVSPRSLTISRSPTGTGSSSGSGASTSSARSAASGQSQAAVESESRARTWSPLRRRITKKSSL